MKYIKEDERGVTCFDEYFSYIDTIQNNVSKSLYVFASDVERYELRNKKSLHDSWLIGLSITNDSIHDFSKTSIKLVLLGQMHDRKHVLNYVDVSHYSIVNERNTNRYEQDLLLHEIRLSNEMIQHEFEFDGDFSILITCRDIEYSEEIIK